MDGTAIWCYKQYIDSSGNVLSTPNITIVEETELQNALDKLDLLYVQAGTNVITSESGKVYFKASYYANSDDNNRVIKEINIYIDKISKRSAKVKENADSVTITVENYNTTLTQKIETTTADLQGQITKEVNQAKSEIKAEQDKITQSVSSLSTTLETDYATKETLNEKIEYTESLITQTSRNWMFELQKVGGDNMVMNSVMKNGTQFWIQHLIDSYYESATAPILTATEKTNGVYWYCTSTNGNYKEGTVYYWAPSGTAWTETTYTRAMIVNMRNPFFYVTSSSSEEALNYTTSGYLMHYDICNVIQSDGTVKNTNVKKAAAEGSSSTTNSETHIFNVTNIMDCKLNEEDVTFSFKFRNSIQVGQVIIGLGFINRELNASMELVETVYEPSIVLTPDDDKEGLISEYLTVKMPKVEDYEQIYPVAYFKASTTVPTVADVYTGGLFWYCLSAQTATINGTSVSFTANTMYYFRTINNSGTINLAVAQVAKTLNSYWICSSSTSSSFTSNSWYNTSMTAVTPPTSYKYMIQQTDGIGVLMKFSNSTLVTDTKIRKCYGNPSGNYIWTYRDIYGGYYRTTIKKVDLKFAGMYLAVTFYGGLVAQTGTGAPTSSTTPTRRSILYRHNI